MDPIIHLFISCIIREIVKQIAHQKIGYSPETTAGFRTTATMNIFPHFSRSLHFSSQQFVSDKPFVGRPLKNHKAFLQA